MPKDKTKAANLRPLKPFKECFILTGGFLWGEPVGEFNFSPEKPIVKSRSVDCVKILLIDDSKTLLHENERVLHKAGYEVICAEDGVSALKMAQAQKPDLILLDMILPRMSGPEVLENLKHDAATAKIPVVVLSSLTEKNREKLIAAGAEEYVEKSTLTSATGDNLLPKLLEDIICRINRKRGISFRDTPTTI
jgi:CheY-like chemotaxis protein